MKITIYNIVWTTSGEDTAKLPTEIELDDFDMITPYNFNPDAVMNMLGDRYGWRPISIDWVFAD